MWLPVVTGNSIFCLTISWELGFLCLCFLCSVSRLDLSAISSSLRLYHVIECSCLSYKVGQRRKRYDLVFILVIVPVVCLCLVIATAWWNHIPYEGKTLQTDIYNRNQLWKPHKIPIHFSAIKHKSSCSMMKCSPHKGDVKLFVPVSWEFLLWRE
jgi:hypothetical protein